MPDDLGELNEEVSRRLRAMNGAHGGRQITLQDGEIQVKQTRNNSLLLIGPGRMSFHITKDTAQELIHVLRHYIRKGKVGFDSFEDSYYVGAYVRGIGVDVKRVFGVITDLDRDGMAYIQNIDIPGPGGRWVVMTEHLETNWEPCAEPPTAPTWHQRILDTLKD